MNLYTSLAKLKKTVIIATVLATVAGITTEPADARSASGRAFQQWAVNFDLETSVSDSNESGKIGVFSEAIRNLIVCYDPADCTSTQLLSSGTISASRIPTPKNRNTEVVVSYSESDDDCTFERLINDPNNTPFEKEGFKKAVIKYEIMFGNSPDRLFLFLPSLGSKELDYNLLVNSLSGTDKLTQIHGIYQAVSADGSAFNNAIGCGYQGDGLLKLEPITSAIEIIEPSATNVSIAVRKLYPLIINNAA